MAAPTIIDTTQMDWITGPDILAEMNPQFRGNLGPDEEVAFAFSNYLVKPLLREEATGRRVDLASFTPGYTDVTACYHESAEEGFVVDGTIDLAFEGHFQALDYFWRPPGWVHGTLGIESGCTALFTFEAESAHEESGPVTRTVVPYEKAGTNPLLGETAPRAIGPRGYVPHRAGRFAAVESGETWAGIAPEARSALDVGRLSVRTLSGNVRTGGGTFLWDLASGYAQPGGTAFGTVLMFFVVSGSVTIGARVAGAGTFVYVPAGTTIGPIAAADGATLYIKTDARLAPAS